jgi:ribosome biogenesis GTPase
VLRGRTSVLVGQSGVGKSSLINCLVPGVEAAVQEISRATEEGRHTTTASALYHLPGGGELMDSPGVRDYAPPLPAPRDVASGFRELAEATLDCRFPDCRHAGEPGCSVEARVKSGEISARRLASYRQLLRLAGEVEKRMKSTGRLGPKGRAGNRFRR